MSFIRQPEVNHRGGKCERICKRGFLENVKMGMQAAELLK